VVTTFTALLVDAGFSLIAKDDGNNITIFTWGSLSRGGLILIGLLSGGDYDQVSQAFAFFLPT
jgi:hypothetical protein